MSPHIEAARALTPIPVDVTRDLWDKLTVAGGIASVITGIVALLVAWASHRKAVHAIAETKAAEVRAIERAAVERRTTFELEVLRDLLEVLDSHDQVLRLFATQPEATMRTRFVSRLSMLPDEDLPFWRQWPLLPADERWSMFPEIRPEELEDVRKTAVHAGPTWALPGRFVLLFVDRLRTDVRDAVARRMTDRDLRH